MDIEKLIERLKGKDFERDYDCTPFECGVFGLLEQALNALSTLQAENKRLNKIVYSIPTTPDSGRTVSQYDKEMPMCAYLDDLEAENEKLRNEVERQRRSADDRKHLYENAERAYMKVVAELEQVKRERDAAVKDIELIVRRINDCNIKLDDGTTVSSLELGRCRVCKHEETGDCDDGGCIFEWRGPKKEN